MLIVQLATTRLSLQLISKLNFFVEAYLVEGRASKSYKYFIDTFLLYQTLFENGGDLMTILEMPYPLYNDIILKQIEEKKREKKQYDQKMSQMKATSGKKRR